MSLASRRRGESVRRFTAMPDATTSGAAGAALPAAVRALVAGVAGPVPIRLALASGTTVDTGSWVRRATVHVVVLDDEVVFVAGGPRPFVRRMPRAGLSAAVYNHVTGQVVLPESGLPGIALDPLEARDLLRLAALP